MERAFDAVADHLAAVSDVGAEVAAVSRQDVQFTRFVAVGDQVVAEVPSGRTSPAGNSADQPTMNQPVTFQVNGTFKPSLL